MSGWVVVHFSYKYNQTDLYFSENQTICVIVSGVYGGMGCYLRIRAIGRKMRESQLPGEKM
jgi:hypothetical protein